MLPVDLAPNQSQRFYRGGARIARFRDGAQPGDRVPEDWIASTTTLYGEPETGLTRLPDGTLLRDAIAAQPQAYLGPDHVAAFGTDPALLVKLLDPGERLPVHCHPSPAFAQRHLGCAHGKNEAWIVLDCAPEDAVVYVGFREGVDPGDIDTWVRGQDSAALLDALHRIPVQPGDTVFVPAGAPHAIGAGVFALELQEPTDFSVLLEWQGFGLDGDTQLGLAREVALGCLDTRGRGAPDVLALCQDRPLADHADGRVRPLFPTQADAFFRAQRIRPLGGAVTLPAGYAVLLVRAGEGELCGAADPGRPWPLRPGRAVLVPHGAGATTISGDVDLFRCLPPAA